MTQPASSHTALVSYADGRAAETPVSALFLTRWSSRAMTGEDIPDSCCSLCSRRRATPRPAITPALALCLRQARHAGNSTGSLKDLARSQSGSGPGKHRLWCWSPPRRPSRRRAQDRTVIVSGAASFDTGAAWASLAFQAALLGWTTRAMGGFDRDKARAATGAPESLNSKPSWLSARGATLRGCRPTRRPWKSPMAVAPSRKPPSQAPSPRTSESWLIASRKSS